MGNMIIYQIINTVNGKKYVGQTIRGLKRRFQEHFHKNSAFRCVGLSRAIVKYGKSAFKIEILEFCKSREELDIREIYWIASLDTVAPNGYNLKSGGSSSKYSEESRIKMSKSATGRKDSPETIIRKKLSNKKKPQGFSETMRLVKSKIAIPVLCQENGIQYESISVASKDLNVNPGHIHRIINGKLKSSKGYTFKRL